MCEEQKKIVLRRTLIYRFYRNIVSFVKTNLKLI